MYILSVPNGGGFSLLIEGGVPARVSWPWGGKPDVLRRDSALMRSLVWVGCVDDFLTSFWLDCLLRSLGRSLVDGMFITDDGVTVMLPFLGGGVRWGRSGVPLFFSGLLCAFLDRLLCLLSLVKFCCAN